jgi:hypothetical protein
MARNRKQQEAPDRCSMNRKFQGTRSTTEAGQAVCEPAVSAHAIGWWLQAQVMVPCLDCVDSMLENVKRNVKGQGVPDEGPKKVVGHR